MNEQIALIFRTVRTSNKMTQAGIAEMLGVSPGHIGLLEQGKAKPSYDVMEKMLTLFSIDANLFFGRTHRNTKSINATIIELMQNLLSEVNEQIQTYGDDVDNILTEVDVKDTTTIENMVTEKDTITKDKPDVRRN